MLVSSIYIGITVSDVKGLFKGILTQKSENGRTLNFKILTWRKLLSFIIAAALCSIYEHFYKKQSKSTDPKTFGLAQNI